jgi:hypothetical protein
VFTPWLLLRIQRGTRRLSILVFAFSLGFGIWDLEFGIWLRPEGPRCVSVPLW